MNNGYMRSLLQKLGLISIIAYLMPMISTQETYHQNNFVHIISKVIQKGTKSDLRQNIEKEYGMMNLYSDLDDNKLGLLAYNLQYVNQMMPEGMKSARYAITAQWDEKKTGTNVGAYNQKLDLIMSIEVAFNTILHETTHRRHFQHINRKEFEQELKPYLTGLGVYYKTKSLNKDLWKKEVTNIDVYVTPYANSSLHEFIAETNEALGTCYYYGSGPLASSIVYDQLDTKKFSEVVTLFRKYGFISKEVHEFFNIYLGDEQLRDVLSEYIWPLSDIRRYKQNDYIQVFPCIEDNFEVLKDKSNLALFLDKAELMNQQEAKNNLLHYYKKELPILEYKKNGKSSLTTWAAYQNKLRASKYFTPSQQLILMGEKDQEDKKEKGIAYVFKALKKLNRLYKKTIDNDLFLGYPLDIEEVQMLEKHFPQRTSDTLLFIAKFYHRRLKNLKPVSELYEPSKFYDLPIYLEVSKTKLFYDEVLSYYLAGQPLEDPLLQTDILLKNRKQIRHYKYLSREQQAILNKKLSDYFTEKYPLLFNVQ